MRGDTFCWIQNWSSKFCTLPLRFFTDLLHAGALFTRIDFKLERS